jgi:hypothetical protein
VLVVLPLALGAVWALSLTQLRLQKMTDIGLISVMPPLTLACLGLLTVSFAVTVTRRPINPLAVTVHVLVLVIALFGITEFVEPVPRFAQVYTHIGVIDYLKGHGTVDPNIDAWFDWPGFFAFGDLLVQLAGWHSALAFAAWGPLLYNLLFLPPLLLIFGWATNDPRVKWLAVWMFYSANWLGDTDYISPQGTAFLLWLTILALLLRHFTPSPRAISPATSLRNTWRRFGPRALNTLGRRIELRPAWKSCGIVLVVLLIYGAIVAGHQLTPVPVVIAVAGLALFAGLSIRGLPVLMAVGLAVWIGFMTTAYLNGHIEGLLGPLGSVGSNITTGVGSRVDGSSGHRLIVRLDLVFSAAVWALGVVGFVRRLRAGRTDIALIVVGITPFLLPALQPYGGEIFLRVFLFALPAAAFLAASAVFPTPEAGRGRRTAGVIAVLGCLVLLGFQYTRYGNERFTNFTHGDVAAVQALYRIAPKGSKLLPSIENLPWTYRDFHSYDYLTGLDDLPGWQVRDPNPAVILRQLKATLGATGGYLIFTPSAQIYAEDFEGVPNVLPRLEVLLRASPDARLLYHAGGSEIFFVRASGVARSGPL